MQRLELVDLHHSLSPGTADQFSKWSATPAGVVGTRIDNIFVDVAKVQVFKDTEIVYCLYSDHQALVSSFRV